MRFEGAFSKSASLPEAKSLLICVNNLFQGTTRGSSLYSSDRPRPPDRDPYRSSFRSILYTGPRLRSACQFNHDVVAIARIVSPSPPVFNMVPTGPCSHQCSYSCAGDGRNWCVQKSSGRTISASWVGQSQAMDTTKVFFPMLRPHQNCVGGRRFAVHYGRFDGKSCHFG
jgi:hypothetical protein